MLTETFRAHISKFLCMFWSDYGVMPEILDSTVSFAPPPSPLVFYEVSHISLTEERDLKNKINLVNKTKKASIYLQMDLPGVLTR